MSQAILVKSPRGRVLPDTQQFPRSTYLSSRREGDAATPWLIAAHPSAVIFRLSERLKHAEQQRLGKTPETQVPRGGRVSGAVIWGVSYAKLTPPIEGLAKRQWLCQCQQHPCLRWNFYGVCAHKWRVKTKTADMNFIFYHRTQNEIIPM